MIRRKIREKNNGTTKQFIRGKIKKNGDEEVTIHSYFRGKIEKKMSK